MKNPPKAFNPDNTAVPISTFVAEMETQREQLNPAAPSRAEAAIKEREQVVDTARRMAAAKPGERNEIRREMDDKRPRFATPTATTKRK
jgi:hypothetical protein